MLIAIDVLNFPFLAAVEHKKPIIEATGIDLAGYPEHVGGLDQVATILSELAEEINPIALAPARRRIRNQ